MIEALRVEPRPTTFFLFVYCPRGFTFGAHTLQEALWHKFHLHYISLNPHAHWVVFFLFYRKESHGPKSELICPKSQVEVMGNLGFKPKFVHLLSSVSHNLAVRVWRSKFFHLWVLVFLIYKKILFIVVRKLNMRSWDILSLTNV